MHCISLSFSRGFPAGRHCQSPTLDDADGDESPSRPRSTEKVTCRYMYLFLAWTRTKNTRMDYQTARHPRKQNVKDHPFNDFHNQQHKEKSKLFWEGGVFLPDIRIVERQKGYHKIKSARGCGSTTGRRDGSI